MICKAAPALYHDVSLKLVVPLVLTTACVASAGTAPSFAESSSYGYGFGARDITSADLDGDGDLDLSIADLWSGDVVVLLNDGAGRFQQGWLSGTGSSAYAVVAGDLDSDGDADLAVSSRNPDALFVFLNQGDATFTPDPKNGQGLSLDRYSTDLVLADWDLDGELDIGASVGYPLVLTNGGEGTFTQGASLPHTVGEGGVAAGDLNGDGMPDLVSTTDDGLVAALGDGAGGFVVSDERILGTSCYSVELGDLNGDGRLDAVAASIRSGHPASGAYILYGHGDGTFLDPVHLESGERLRGVAIVDLEGDGDLDIAMTDYGRDGVFILVNNGSGEFDASSQELILADGPSDIITGDFDADGLIDLAFGSVGSRITTVLRNRSDGSGPCVFADITAPEGIIDLADIARFVDGFRAGDLAVDFTGNGVLDLQDLFAFQSGFRARCP